MRTALIALCSFFAIGVGWLALSAQQPPRGKPPAAPPERARPPVWNERSKSAFFDDPREALVGARPDYGKRPAEGPATPATADGDASPSAGGVFAWSKIIAPDVIEDEVKRIAQGVNETVVNPQQYAGGGYKAGQDHFSMLAVLFAIVAEYDGDVRWQRHAIAAREEFAAAGFGSRVGSIQAFNQAKAAREDLAGMIAGQTLKGKEGEAKASWGKVAYRPPLMRRLRTAQEERLNGWTANAAEFKKHADEILHEAQIAAALAEVITRDGFEFADDDTYLDYAKQLKKTALDVVDAVKQNNPANARTAMGAMGKSCKACHDDYRG